MITDAAQAKLSEFLDSLFEGPLAREMVAATIRGNTFKTVLKVICNTANLTVMTDEEYNELASKAAESVVRQTNTAHGKPRS